MRQSFSIVLSIGCCVLFWAANDSVAAEMRVWNAANGGFSIEAELVELKPGDVVRLKSKDGREIEVPLAQLSAADREYVKNLPKAGAVSPRLAKAQRTADRCRMPDEALVVYQVFHDDPQTDPAEKAIAAARIAELKELSAKKMVRLKKKWVPADEANVIRKQADELMRQGLELIRLDNENAFRQKFHAAATLEPEEIRADFLAAVIYTARREGDKALPLFQKCLARDPDNIAVLNNMALLSVAKADWGAVTYQWRRTLDLQPDQRVIHNIGRFLEQSTESNINIPKNLRDSLSLPYAELVASGKFRSTEPEVGWLFLLIEASDLDIDFRKDDKEKPRDVTPAATEDGPVIGGGTGFVVHPGYVLTNAHVAQDDTTFEIQLPDGKLLKATRVAKADKADLALLKCEELKAPPLALSPTMVPRGTDVMLLGYPEMTTLGASLKATRGSISSVPDPAVNDRYLYDAVTNAGNSGGPVCDEKGNVIAVHYLGINTASRYGGGIPSPQALAFLRLAIQDFKPLAPHELKLDWPQVDEKVSPSTVLIWVRKKNAKAASSKIGSDLVELPICLFCSGAGDLRCALGCKNGVLVRGGRAGTCPSCGGDGMVKCHVCAGVGIDVQLASVQSVLAAAVAAKKAANATAPPPAAATGTAGKPATTTPPPTTTASTTPGPTNNGPIGYDWRLPPAPKRRLADVELNQILQGLQSPTAQVNTESAKRLHDATPNSRYQNQIAQLLERRMMVDIDWIRRSVCTRALEVWGRKESLKIVIGSMNHSSWITREHAMYYAGRSGEMEGALALIGRLKNPNDVVGSPIPYDPKGERNRIAQILILFGPKAKAEVEKLRRVPDADLQPYVEQILKAYGP
jgi:S1-C subfamily serine protease